MRQVNYVMKVVYEQGKLCDESSVRAR